MQKGKLKKYEIVLLLLMGMLCFSSLGSKVAQNVLHLPLSLPELFFIPLFALLEKRFTPTRFDKNTFSALIFLLLFLILLSQVVGEYSIFAVLSSARGYLYLFLFLCIFKTNTKYNDDIIVLVCFGAIIGWFIDCNFGYQQMAAIIDETVQTNGNMLSVAIFIVYTMLLKKWKLFFAGLIMILYICLFAGIRRVILVATIAFAISVILQFLFSKLSIFKQIFLVGIVVVPIIFAIPVLDRAVEEINPKLHYRIFGKTENMMSGESSYSDDLRKEHINQFFNSPIDYLYPKGMVSNQYYTDQHAGIFMDFPLVALSHMFGLPFAIVIILYFSLNSYRCLLLYKRRKIIASGVYCAMGAIFIVLLFVEGSFLVHPFTTPMTGMCLGRILFYSKQLGIKKYR